MRVKFLKQRRQITWRWKENPPLRRVTLDIFQLMAMLQPTKLILKVLIKYVNDAQNVFSDDGNKEDIAPILSTLRPDIINY